MLTLRQIERWWNAKSYTRLLDELCAGRAEGVAGIRDLLDDASSSPEIAAAALTIIRAGELRQMSHPLIGKLIGLLLRTQNAGGGWDNVVTTALAARSLAQTGTGAAVDAALNYLADAQNADGEWAIGDDAFVDNAGHTDSGALVATLTRTATLTDMAVTAFVLYQLATIRRPVAALLIDDVLTAMLAPDPAHVDTQLNTLRRRIEARRVLASAA